MNDRCLMTADIDHSGVCGQPMAQCVVNSREQRMHALAELLGRVLAAPYRLHGYRNLNTRLVRDAFCLRDCGSDAND